MVKFGIMPPMKKGVHTNPTWVRRFIKMAEKAEVESVWTAEHPIIAENYERLYSYSEDGSAPFSSATEMSDPLEWLAFAAGISEKLKLGTGVLLLPLHAPIILAKRVATVDALSGGRVLLGVGMGWQKEEYETIGVPYTERGKRLDEGVAAVRALWSQSPASFQGQYYRFSQVYSDPKPAQVNGVPIIIGGSTSHAARRAGRIGDGYFPHAISPDDLHLRLEEMRSAAREVGRDPSEIELTVTPSSWRRAAIRDRSILKAYLALGAKRIVGSSGEANSTDIEDIERYTLDCAELLTA